MYVVEQQTLQRSPRSIVSLVTVSEEKLPKSGVAISLSKKFYLYVYSRRKKKFFCFFFGEYCFLFSFSLLKSQLFTLPSSYIPLGLYLCLSFPLSFRTNVLFCINSILTFSFARQTENLSCTKANKFHAAQFFFPTFIVTITILFSRHRNV